MFAMSESPKFRQITKNTNLVSKKGKIGWHCEAQHHIYLFCRNPEKRYPYVTKAAAQQQHSRSSSGGGGGGGGVEGGAGGAARQAFFCRAVAAAP